MPLSKHLLTGRGAGDAGLRDVYNVLNSDYAGGADPTGVNDVTLAFQAAIDAAYAAGGGTVYIPAGSYKKLRTSANIVIKSGVHVRGDGIGITKLLLDNTGGGTGRWFYCNTASSHDISFEDLSVTGSRTDADYTQTQQMFELRQIAGLRLNNVEISYSQSFGIIIGSCDDVVVENCKVHHNNGDGISVQSTPNARICKNLIYQNNDDGISGHCQDSDAFPRTGLVITDNILNDTQGIAILGAKKVTIANNMMQRIAGYGIFVLYSPAFNQGNTPLNAINIHDNVIDTVFQRTWGGGGYHSYIIIGGGQRNAGSGAAAPGMNKTADGTIVNLYGTTTGNFEINNTDNTANASPGGYFINVKNNICVQTLPPVSAYSDWGYGVRFTGPYSTGFDGAISTFASRGIEVYPFVNNMLIEGNTISDVSESPVFFNPDTFTEALVWRNVVVRNNILHEFTNYGVSMALSTAQDITIDNNLFDGDPLFINANRRVGGGGFPDGSWAASGNPAAVRCSTGAGLKVINNTIKNCCLTTTFGASAFNIIKNNRLQATVGSAGGFSTANKGIGNCPLSGEQFWYEQTDCDPTSATYGQILSQTLFDAISIPTAGTYVKGHFVRNISVSVSGNTVLLGWLRLTTGSAHVSGTDWQPIYAASVSGTLAEIATQNAFTKQQYFAVATITSTSNSIAWNAQTAQVAVHTATENTTLANPTNLVAGSTYILRFVQHASSAKTLAFGNAYKWVGGVAPVVSTGASAVDLFSFYTDGTNMYGTVLQNFS